MACASATPARPPVVSRLGQHVSGRLLGGLVACVVLGLVTTAARADRVVATREATIYALDGSVTGTIPKGAQAELLGARKQWVQIRYTPEGGQPVEGWAREAYFDKLPSHVEALRDTPILNDLRREIGTMREGERAELLEVQEIHLLVRYTLPDGTATEGLVRKVDMIEAEVADFARKVREALDGSVQVRRAAGFEQRRRKTFGKEKTVVEIIRRSETLWLEIILTSKEPVAGLQVKYQIYKKASDLHGQSQVVEGISGMLTPKGQVGDQPCHLMTQFSKFEWEDQIVDPDQPAVSKRFPDVQTGESFEGYRVEVYWRGFFLKSFELNAPPPTSS
jgi:hypothetical protein